MKLRRTFVLPSLAVGLGLVVVACGDDDTNGNSNGGVYQLPGADGGFDAKPSTPTDSGSDGSSGGEGGTNEGGVDAGGLDSGKDAGDGGDGGPPPAADALVLTSDGKLSAFSTEAPSLAAAPVTITGVNANDTLVSIDRRPQNGFIYGLGYNSVGKSVTLYAIDPETRNAVALGPASTSTTAITGPVFGSDFNPTADRLRVVTSAGQNFRLNPNTGAFVDFDANAGNGNTQDGALNNGTSTAGAETAYTSNRPNNGNITTQYTIAATTLYVQNPPNDGKLVSPHPLSNVESIFGFDISSAVSAPTNGVEVTTGAGLGVAKLSGNAASQLVSINLPDGAVTTIGAFPFSNIVGFTLAPAPTSRAIVALSGDGASLIRFDESTPGTVTTQALATGSLATGETLVGIDFRPRTGQLYGLGINATSNKGTLYLIDPQSGAISSIGVSTGLVALTTDGVTAVDLPAANTGWGFDFNPNVDRIRVTTASGLNFRINQLTGLVVDGNNGGVVTTGDNPDGAITGGLDSVAYTNGSPVTLDTGVTTEYGLNVTTDSLAIVTTPNAGTLGTAIPIMLGGSPLNFTGVAGFDIPQSVKTLTANAAPPSGSGYAALTVAGVTGLYKINLVDGAATFLGKIGAGTVALRGLTVGR